MEFCTTLFLVAGTLEITKGQSLPHCLPQLIDVQASRIAAKSNLSVASNGEKSRPTLIQTKTK